VLSFLGFDLDTLTTEVRIIRSKGGSN